uniref:Putative disease resistance RPP13-like protein 3 n=1 Tax=Aegilops tauschii TaxID=37682 RepID=M8BLF4_AEGTA
MAEAVIGALVGKLQELAMSEARAMVAVNEDIRSLRDKLMWMQAFLRDVEPRRRLQNDELIRVWLQQTRSAVFDSEDAVDQYILQVDLSRYPSWTRATLKFFASFTTQVRVRRNLSSRIKSINTRLEGIIANKDRYKIEDASAVSVVTWRPSADTFTSTEKMDKIVLPIVARQTQLDDLKKYLEAGTDTTRPEVIYVIGKSGVGKTKLVRNMYEEYWTKNHFDVQAWVSFAPNLSASNILKLIIQRLKEDNVTCSRGEARKNLKEELEKGKYLLVIDGEVSSTEWKSILNDLPDGMAGSKVVQITQTKPESSPSTLQPIELEDLNEDEATNLFLKTLFMKEKGKKYWKAVKEAVGKNHYGKDIFEITGGLPLAVVLLSGLLRTKEYPGEWEKVFDYLKNKAIQWKRLDSVLSMCFDDLPHDMKSCFLYFAALPVNTLIRARSLVCMWMAEGFLRPKDGKQMEKVGEQYLKELIARRLVNLAPMEYEASGDERVAVQTKVHDFLLHEAQEASFVEVHGGDDIPILSNARRLSLQNHRDKYAALANYLPKLRSILSNFEEEVEARKEEDQLGSEYLRVINLHGLEIGDTLPSDIGNVVHLQYLGITSCSLKQIPPSIGKLTGLQTLDVRDTEVTTLPEEFWKIQSLRHVFGFLVLPRRVGRLTQLQTLESIEPDQVHGWGRRTLEKMLHLQSLYIWKLPERNANALTAVCKLKYLMLLSIEGESITSNLFPLSNLPRLQEMRLKGVIVPPTLPESSGFYLPNLTKLSLEQTKVTKEFINKLGKLPFLATLALNHDSYEDKDHHLVFTSGFQSLKELVLDVALKKIEIGESVFPQLMVLEVFSYSDDICAVIHGNRYNIRKLIKANGVPIVVDILS